MFLWQLVTVPLHTEHRFLGYLLARAEFGLRKQRPYFTIYYSFVAVVMVLHRNFSHSPPSTTEKQKAHEAARFFNGTVYGAREFLCIHSPHTDAPCITRPHHSYNTKLMNNISTSNPCQVLPCLISPLNEYIAGIIGWAGYTSFLSQTFSYALCCFVTTYQPATATIPYTPISAYEYDGHHNE